MSRCNVALESYSRVVTLLVLYESSKIYGRYRKYYLDLVSYAHMGIHAMAEV